MKLPRLRCSGLIALTAIVLLLGCRDRRRHQASHAASAVQADPSATRNATPAEVVGSLLESLARLQRARAAGLGVDSNQEAYDEAMARVWSLAAGADLRERLLQSRSATIPRNLSEEAALTIISESWASMLAHYIEGVRLETLKFVPNQPQGAAAAYVEAHPPGDERVLAELTAANANRGAASEADKPALTTGWLEQPRLRERAIDRGVCPPTAVGITIRLQKFNDGWKVTQVKIGPSKASHPLNRRSTTASGPASSPMNLPPVSHN